MARETFFGRNMVGQAEWELRGAGDARIRAAETRLTTLEAASRPRGLLGRAAVTADQGAITVQVTLTGVTVTVTPLANRYIRVYAETYFQNTAVNFAAGARMFLVMDGGNIQQCDYRLTQANVPEKFTASVIVTPSAASHTFVAQADNGGGGTVTMIAGAAYPTYIMVEDLGGT